MELAGVLSKLGQKVSLVSIVAAAGEDPVLEEIALKKNKAPVFLQMSAVIKNK